LFQLLGKALIGQASHQLGEHVGRSRIAAAVKLSASDQEQGLGDTGFSSAGVAGNDQTLLSRNEVQLSISSTWALSTPVWNSKSKSERSLRSGGRECLILRSMLCSIRALASMARIRSMSSVGGKTF
jgi:hypothetical protein